MNLQTFIQKNIASANQALYILVKEEMELPYREHTDDPVQEKAMLTSDYRHFLEHLMELKPDATEKNSILTIIPTMEDPEMTLMTDCYIYRLDELMNYNPEFAELAGTDVTALSEEEVEKLMRKIMDSGLLISWGYEFSPWEKWLGLSVDTESFNLEKDGIVNGLAAVLREMGFNGITEEAQRRRRDALEETRQEADRIQAMSEEERDRHLHSLNELEETIDWLKDTRSEEEKHADMIRMYRISIDFRIRRDVTIQRIQESAGRRHAD